VPAKLIAPALRLALVPLELGAARAKVEQDINKRDVLRHRGKAQKEIDLIIEAIAERSGTQPPS